MEYGSKQPTRLSSIPNIDRILGMRVINNPEAFGTEGKESFEDLRVASAACCAEASYLATAFGPDFLEKEITLEQFLEAFQVGEVQPSRLDR